MSPNWLSAIGQATPAITATMREMQERPKEEARWGWEQEQMGMKREQFGQQKALGEQQINALKYQDEQRKKKEELRKTPYNYKSDIAFAGLPEEFVEKTIGRAKSMGLKMDTMGDREDYFAKLKESPPMIKEFNEAKDFELQRVAGEAFDNYEELLKKPGVTPDKIEKALEAVNMANAKRAQGKDAGDKYLKAIGFKLSHEKLMNSREFKALPWEKQQVIDKAAISVLQGANPKEYADAVKETLFPKGKETTPSWKVVQDPKSSTGYSYQDMNNPTGELRTGAPAPKAVAEVRVDIGGKSFTEMGKKMGERVVEQHKDAEQAIDSLKRLQDAKKLLSSGMITGAGAGYILSVGKVLQQGGISLAPDAIANTEAYAAMMGNQVGQIIKQFGAGTGLSDADREYAEKIAGGKITLTKQSLEKIIDLNEKGLRNAVQSYNKRAKEIMDKPEGKDLPYDLRIDVPSGLMGEGGKGLIHYYVGDNEYFIPPEKESSFIKKYPNAKKAK